ncbi:hypothetical protein ACFFX0_25145 [Citricoccus parietis]|uniref:Uncharacterized protein n=1 Tax=Citricoccus parietis TaxID=592307 RepID=A0ABV5G5R8_9MICC
MELVPQSIAATVLPGRRDAAPCTGFCSPASRFTWRLRSLLGTGAPGSQAPAHQQVSAVQSSRMRPSASSPRGFTPGPAASEWPTRTCRHLTRSGMPPAEMPEISGTSSVPATRPTRSRSAR